MKIFPTLQKLLTAITFALVLVSVPALAAPLDDAKAAGLIVEIPTGYVDLAQGARAPKDIQDLVVYINKRRKEAYERIAKKNGISVDHVAAESYRVRMEKDTATNR